MREFKGQQDPTEIWQAMSDLEDGFVDIAEVDGGSGSTCQSDQSPQLSREALELEGLGPSAETMELAALQASHRGRLSRSLRRARGHAPARLRPLCRRQSTTTDLAEGVKGVACMRGTSGLGSMPRPAAVIRCSVQAGFLRCLALYMPASL